MIDIQLVDPKQMPEEIDGYAFQRRDEVRIVTRQDFSAARLADVVGRLCADMTREALDATYHGSEAAPE